MRSDGASPSGVHIAALPDRAEAGGDRLCGLVPPHAPVHRAVRVFLVAVAGRAIVVVEVVDVLVEELVDALAVLGAGDAGAIEVGRRLDVLKVADRPLDRAEVVGAAAAEAVED